MNLTAETYKDKLLLTKRGNNHGVFSNAKPIYVLSIIDAIAEGVIIGNKIQFGNGELEEIYRRRPQTASCAIPAVRPLSIQALFCPVSQS